MTGVDRARRIERSMYSGDEPQILVRASYKLRVQTSSVDKVPKK